MAFTIPQKGSEVFLNWQYDSLTETMVATIPAKGSLYSESININNGNIVDQDVEPKIKMFPLENIDQMKIDILGSGAPNAVFKINKDSLMPYGLMLNQATNPLTGVISRSQLSPLEGLGLKTYQSDLYNNWLLKDSIDDVTGIAAISKVDTTGDSFTIDALNIQKKIYDMYNRIVASGGTLDDYIEVIYDHERYRSQEQPSYEGGLIKELVFQEVISNVQSANEQQPLGTLAGRGVMGKKHKGGNLIVKADEWCYLMGVISLTPRVDYSQGNSWDMNLKTMDDFHKPPCIVTGKQIGRAHV